MVRSSIVSDNGAGSTGTGGRGETAPLTWVAAGFDCTSAALTAIEFIHLIIIFTFLCHYHGSPQKIFSTSCVDVVCWVPFAVEMAKRPCAAEAFSANPLSVYKEYSQQL
ncbi:unnamed protein product [Anisakis simplex]|uniref:Transmembrane protein n=1 Tax=Anisakis simplex TaxID=6269 RepID=A0A0M3KFD9_ANISI|nr:unnamed protein product [Anisakis simplex]